MGNAAAKRDAIASAASNGNALDLANMLDQLSVDDRNYGKYYDEGDDEGRTPLHHASSNGFVVVVELLLRAGANKNELDNNGRTPLYLAVANEHVDVVELLVRMGVDLDHSFTATSQLDGDVEHEPPLHHAADRGLLGMVQMLLHAGADPNKRFSDIGKTYSGCTPLHRATRNGHADVVKALIDGGGGVNNIENGGNTPVHLAAFRGYLTVCKVLVENGADLDRRNNQNQTPLDMARRGGFKEIGEYFEQCLAVDPLQRQSTSLKAAMAKKDTLASTAKARRDNANEAASMNAPSPSPSEKKLFGAFRHVTQSMSKMVSGYRIGGTDQPSHGSDGSDYDLSSIIESVGHSSSILQSGDDYDVESEPLATDMSPLGVSLSDRRLSATSSSRRGTKQDDAATSRGELKLPALFPPTTNSSSQQSSSHQSSSHQSSGHSSSTVSGYSSVKGNTTPVSSATGGRGSYSAGAIRGGMGLMPSMLQTASILALSMKGGRFCAEDDGEDSDGDSDGDPTNENSIAQLRHLLEQHNIGRHATQGDEDPYKDRTGVGDDALDSSDDDSDDDAVHDVFASCYERQQRDNTPTRSPAPRSPAPRSPAPRSPAPRSKVPSGFQSLSSSLKLQPTSIAASSSSSTSSSDTSPSQRPASAGSKLSLPYLLAGFGLGSSNKEVNAKVKAPNTPLSGTSTPIMPRLTTATTTMGTLSAAASALTSPSPR